MGGGQWSSLHLPACLFGGQAGQLGRALHLLGRQDFVAQQPAEGRVDGSEASRTSASGVATSQAAGIAACTNSGLKLKKVETTTSAVTAPMGAARDAK